MCFCEGRDASCPSHITNHKVQAGNRLHLVLVHEMPRKCLKEQRPNRRAHEYEEPKKSPQKDGEGRDFRGYTENCDMDMVSGDTRTNPGHSTENHRKNQLSKEFKLC